jgi:hypothetical protein
MPTGSQPAGAYVDACERCMPITPRRHLYVTVPWRILPDPRNPVAVIAFYRNTCGHQWHTGWHRRTAA